MLQSVDLAFQCSHRGVGGGRHRRRRMGSGWSSPADDAWRPRDEAFAAYCMSSPRWQCGVDGRVCHRGDDGRVKGPLVSTFPFSALTGAWAMAAAAAAAAASAATVRGWVAVAGAAAAAFVSDASNSVVSDASNSSDAVSSICLSSTFPFSALAGGGKGGGGRGCRGDGGPWR